MTTSIKKLFLILPLCFAALLFSSCSSSEKADISKEIVGVWCDLDGPYYEYIEAKPEDSYYMVYEFTSDGKLIHHMLNTEKGYGYYEDDVYTIEGNTMTVAGEKCRVAIKDGQLNLINSDGTIKYRRMTMKEMLDVGMTPFEESIRENYINYVSSVAAEEGGTTAANGGESDTAEANDSENSTAAAAE
ncbi:MAG: hypothetical protein J6F31_02825 [Oscillospiraceae bacterium]|nr:hypothetical protein [Oscillospiraceae bacterium]